MAKRQPHTISMKEADKALRDATANWADWQVVYNHRGGIASNPLLTDRFVFGCFLWEYGVARTLGYKDGESVENLYSTEKARRLQNALRNDAGFVRAVADGNVQNLYECIPRLGEKHSAKNSVGGIFSLITKVAALCNPSGFIASDTFARAGIAKLIKGTKTSFNRTTGAGACNGFTNYQKSASDLATVHARWPNGMWEEIGASAKHLGAPEKAFRLRCVDNVAMLVGRVVLEKKSADKNP